MTSGLPTRLLLAASLATSLPAIASAPDAPRVDARATTDASALLARIARPAPATVEYAEVRFSKLLIAPVVTTGRLDYAGPDRLAKHVEAPYREDLFVERDEVRVERAGQSPKRIPMARAPELRGLLASFGALLGGDRAALERTFQLDVTEAADGWRLKMTPRDARVRSRLKVVDVVGRADAPRCLTVIQADGTTSTMLFATLAREAWPAQFGPELVAKRCGANGA
jgi:hypothetical protein